MDQLLRKQKEEHGLQCTTSRICVRMFMKEWVEAEIAEQEEAEINYGTGFPSKYGLTSPEYLLLIDETGCYANQLNDGKVGGEVFIMP
jgi:hypothetical protein